MTAAASLQALNITVVLPRGNDAGYLANRLKRDHPAIVERMKAGEFKSVKRQCPGTRASPPRPGPTVAGIALPPPLSPGGSGRTGKSRPGRPVACCQPL